MTECALLVEDDALLAAALAGRLTQAGLVVRHAADRGAALAQAEGCSFALVDLGLPPLPASPEEGLLLIELFAQRHPLMPILVLTGQDEDAAAREAIARGAFDFLAKPVAGAALDLAIARARRQARVLGELARRGAVPVAISAHESRQGLREASELAQEKLLRQMLAASGGNVAEAARRLGIERTRLYYYLDKFGIRAAGAEAQDRRIE